MNQVSDVNLAIAIHEAGAFPSIIITHYIKDNIFDFGAYKSDLEQFQNKTKSTNLLLSVGFKLILNDSIIKPFFELGFKHIELFHFFANDTHWPIILEKCKYLEEKYDAKIIFKISTNEMSDDSWYRTIILKGEEAAGRSSDFPKPIKEKFIDYKTKFPNINIIPCGGIYNYEQVKFYMDNGALAVGVGSLFAASEESSLSVESKQKIINSAKNNITLGGQLNFKGLFASIVENDDLNLTKSLQVGVNNPDKGCIYVGDAIDHITEILPVKTIIDRLMNNAIIS
jgi:hypothetical protein